MSLPVLDVLKYTHGNAQEQEQFGQDLLRSFQKHGFVKLVNHGFDQEYVDQLMDWSSRFFNLDTSTKASIQNQKSINPQRGYSGIGGENLKKFALDGTGEDFVDVKVWLTLFYSDGIPPSEHSQEHFDQGPRNDGSFPNQWPPETSSNGLVGFRSFMESYFDTTFTLSQRLLSILEAALKVPSGTLVSRCNRNHNELRLNHYPATTIEEIKNGRVRRSGAHTDYGVLTLLFQDCNGGLEVQDRSAPGPDVKFTPVSADDPYALIVNVADTLQRWTNRVVPAGLHQVTIPGDRRDDATGKLPERYSIAYFMKSNRDETIGSLPEFVSGQRPAEFEHITAIDYHKKRHALLYA